jgi:hypothetical protein
MTQLGLSRNSRLGFSHRLNNDLCLFLKIIEATADDRIAARSIAPAHAPACDSLRQNSELIGGGRGWQPAGRSQVELQRSPNVATAETLGIFAKQPPTK